MLGSLFIGFIFTFNTDPTKTWADLLWEEISPDGDEAGEGNFNSLNEILARVKSQKQQNPKSTISTGTSTEERPEESSKLTPSTSTDLNINVIQKEKEQNKTTKQVNSEHQTTKTTQVVVADIPLESIKKDNISSSSSSSSNSNSSTSSSNSSINSSTHVFVEMPQESKITSNPTTT